jgi:hypothetical protein
MLLAMQERIIEKMGKYTSVKFVLLKWLKGRLNEYKRLKIGLEQVYVEI